MMFGRRQGEILFRPVVGVELLLVGDPPKHKAMHPFFAETAGESWFKRMFLHEAGPDEFEKIYPNTFKQMYMGEWAAPPGPLVDDSPRYADIKRSDTGASFVWGGQRGGKTARLDDFYRNHYTMNSPQPRIQTKYYPPGLKPVAADFNNSVEREVARVSEGEAAQ
jgi:hypothetical protein